MENVLPAQETNGIGAYGPWAASLAGEGPGAFSWRHPQWTDLAAWQAAARQRFHERLAAPTIPGPPAVTIHRTFEHEGIQFEDLSWQLPYGPPTRAYLLKPVGATGKLPAVLGLHCHSGLKYFGREKLVRLPETSHPLLERIWERDGGVGWANELARRGYVVLVHDTYAFGSRRVLLRDVSPPVRGELTDPDWEDVAGIERYNRWAAEHESIMAKSLFCAGTTWPGVVLAEDRAALDVLASRADVDTTRIGTAGLSGGGLRTVLLAGADERIACAVCVGMMTTWRDYLLNKAYTHTWMIYTPLLPNELDYPEILGLRVPQPTLVISAREDRLFTLPEMERADQMLQAIYAKAGAPDRYRGSFYPGGHRFDLPMQAEAFDWFDRWLK
jgi:dienelactone hydrolase